jgi:hypothetical protein
LALAATAALKSVGKGVGLPFVGFFLGKHHSSIRNSCSCHNDG